MVLEILNPWRLVSSSSSPPPTSEPEVLDFEPTSLTRLLFRSPVKLLLYHAYHVITAFRSTPPPSDSPIRIVCISDTHNLIPEDIPRGDVLVHAGDMTNGGSVEEIQKQIDWLVSLPHREIVVISGNHDTYLDPRTRPSLSEAQRSGTLDWKRIHYLQHRKLRLTVTVEPSDGDSVNSRTSLLTATRSRRKLRFYGAPQIPACGPMSVHAFQYPRGRDAWSETVPEDTDILITHTPPRYHLDLPLPKGMGCDRLLGEVERVKPLVHIFGHVHWSAGQIIVWWDGCHDAYVKGMSIQSKWTGGLLNWGLWMCVVKVLYRGIRGIIWDRVWGGRGSHTIMVNAAQMKGNTGKLGNAVQIVDV